MKCEAERVTQYWSDTPGSDRKCNNNAKYVIEGRSLCAKHAAPTALKILVEREEIDVLEICHICKKAPGTHQLANMHVCKKCMDGIKEEIQNAEKSVYNRS